MIRYYRLAAVLFVGSLILQLGPACRASEDDLAKGISLDLKDADLRMIFDLYGEILGVQLEIDPVVGGTISITFDDITVRTSLNAICESAKCRWQLIDGDPRVLRVESDAQEIDSGGPRPEQKPRRIEVITTGGAAEERYDLESPVSLDLVDADATKVLEVAAKIIDARLLLDRKLKGQTITVQTSGVPLSTVLDTTCEKLGCIWELTDGEPPTLGVRYP